MPVKSTEQLGRILQRGGHRTSISLLLGRQLDKAVLAAIPEGLRTRIDYDPVSRTGFFDHNSRSATRGSRRSPC